MIVPFTSGAAAYCYTYPEAHPSLFMGLGVFFTSWSITLIARTINAQPASDSIL